MGRATSRQSAHSRNAQVRACVGDDGLRNLPRGFACWGWCLGRGLSFYTLTPMLLEVNGGGLGLGHSYECINLIHEP